MDLVGVWGGWGCEEEGGLDYFVRLVISKGGGEEGFIFNDIFCLELCVVFGSVERCVVVWWVVIYDCGWGIYSS